MVKGVTRRQLMRKISPNIIPTPYWQLNALSNANGYPKNSIFVLLDRLKARKTFGLINISRGYLSMKKNVLYIDTENGKNNIMERMIQSTLNKTKLDLLSGEYDKIEQRHMRKYKRLKVEFIVERVPALVSDCNTIKNIINKVESELDLKINVPEEKIYIRADGRRLYRVMENLFSNISKYSLPNTRVYIDITKDENSVKLTMKNISSYELNFDPGEIMERFKRADDSRNTEGSGLGLSIAKDLVKLQGGSFDIDIDGDLFKAIVQFNLYK